jgi:hypothetical protein
VVGPRFEPPFELDFELLLHAANATIAEIARTATTRTRTAISLCVDAYSVAFTRVGNYPDSAFAQVPNRDSAPVITT